MDDTKKIRLIHKSRETTLSILKERGFLTDDYSGFNINEIHSMYTNKQLDFIVKKEKSHDKVYVKYYLEKTFRANTIYDMIDDLYNIEKLLSKDDNLIIIIKDEPNESLIKLQQAIYEHDKIFLSIININRLQFNILDHQLVPKHTILLDDEKQKIKEYYNIIDDSKFPNISRFDPVAIVLGMRPDQLCRIERPSKTSITSYFYRLCSH